jgi:hypothetical protein
MSSAELIVGLYGVTVALWMLEIFVHVHFIQKEPQPPMADQFFVLAMCIVWPAAVVLAYFCLDENGESQ